MNLRSRNDSKSRKSQRTRNPNSVRLFMSEHVRNHTKHYQYCIIDEHSREFENSLKIWYRQCRTIILRNSSTHTMLQPTQSSEIIPNFKMVEKWMGSLLMLNKFSTLLKLFSEIVSREVFRWLDSRDGLQYKLFPDTVLLNSSSYFLRLMTMIDVVWLILYESYSMIYQRVDN